MRCGRQEDDVDTSFLRKICGGACVRVLYPIRHSPKEQGRLRQAQLPHTTSVHMHVLRHFLSRRQSRFRTCISGRARPSIVLVFGLGTPEVHTLKSARVDRVQACFTTPEVCYPGCHPCPQSDMSLSSHLVKKTCIHADPFTGGITSRLSGPSCYDV